MRILRVRIAVQTFNHRLGLLAIHPTSFGQEVDRFLIRSNNTSEPADLSRHVGHGGALVHAEFFDGLPRILHHFRERLAAAHVVEAQNLKDEVLRRGI